jgi:hypothetical protein
MLSELAVEDSPAAGQAPMDCVLELRHLTLKRRLAEIQKGLAAAEGPALEALLQEKNEVSRLIANL